MRIRIRHLMSYAWRTPAKSIIQVLRLTPRNHQGQRVGTWYTDVGVDHALRMNEDAYGNNVHTINIDGPLVKLTVSVEGDVETFDTAGVVRDSVERFPPLFYLRSTPDTESSNALRDFASATTSKIADPLGKMHALMGGISDTIACEKSTPMKAAEAFEKARGISAFRPAMSAAIISILIGRLTPTPPAAGRNPGSTGWAGSDSIRQDAFARQKVMSPSHAHSTISELPRCGRPAAAETERT